MFVKPPGPRHTITELADGFIVRIPAQRNLLLISFISLWLCGWIVGEFLAPVAFFVAAQEEPGVWVFLLFWLCGWTTGGAFAIYIWLWQLKGCEVVTISSTALSIKRDILGYGRTQYYDVTEIRQLRVSPFTFNPFDLRHGMAFWGFDGGILAFDYGFKTYRFGAGVDEAEAFIILRTITARFPRLAEVNIG